MGWVRVTNVLVRNENPSGVLSDLKFEVSFVTEQDLQAPLVWRLVYVGCADDTSKDQELELIEIGPLKKGALRFNFESDPPDFTLIDPNDVWGTTVILLEASYKDQEFVRVGWYVHNYYPLQQLQDDPPDIPLFDHMNRYIVADEPRVTTFEINWSGEEPAAIAPSLPPNEQLGFLPGQAVPGQAVPGQAVPGQAVPGQAVPGQAVPGHAVPGHAGHSGFIPGHPLAGQVTTSDDAAMGDNTENESTADPQISLRDQMFNHLKSVNQASYPQQHYVTN